ncbi:expressed unknown protein [Ectocarpus siliculosus]|uniref:Uncharacterized protein n=1 Tax=Ectocarpus siliculosus TaxID=2880 RepID=D7FMV7_ECTSI|nr:expressed unknown protein [Ectocarpus siliculosus]|eukprot:CBJ30021.1 expressed unknown protein [Ectocarpus siliculosus]
MNTHRPFPVSVCFLRLAFSCLLHPFSTRFVFHRGFFIIFSGVFSAYIIATMIRTMPIDQLEKLTAELGGGNEIADLEAQRIETTKRFKELTKDMAQAADPTMGVKPDDALSERLSQQTTKALQTDIASIEDEYGD